jgi:hypothetical protein
MQMRLASIPGSADARLEGRNRLHGFHICVELLNTTHCRRGCSESRSGVDDPTIILQ